MKVLFLDDDPYRRNHAIRHYQNDELSIVDNARDAVKMLQRYSPYDLVSLDHDLGANALEPHREPTGNDVARFITRLPKDKLPRKVIVHSFNPDGAKRIIDTLTNILDVEYIPFNLAQ